MAFRSWRRVLWPLLLLWQCQFAGGVVRRFQASELEVRVGILSDVPVIIEGLVDSWPARHKWTLPFLQKVAGHVRYEFSILQGTKAAKFTDTLHSFLTHLPKSKHENAFYLMTENLLTDVPKLREDITVPELLQPNLFQSFPKEARLTDAVVLGGLGSSSSLHADPFNFTGWNGLIAGEKDWIFFPPSTPAHLFEHSRSPKHANISASFHSPKNLFEIRKGEGVFEAPSFAQSTELRQYAIACVQRAGDVIIIPGGWWHQVYHRTSTLAFASQIFNSHNWQSVVSHILDWVQPGAHQLQSCNQNALQVADSRRLATNVPSEIEIRDFVQCMVDIQKQKVTISKTKKKKTDL